MAESAQQVLAKIRAAVEPGDRNRLPEKWEQIADGWLRGETTSNLQKISEDAVRFIEEGLVYRLVWAIEAIRVRSRANVEQLFGEQPSPVVAAIETGTISIPASILVQAGLPSRVAAFKALKDTPASFETPTGMRQWLFSGEVQTATTSPDWPTRETSVIWKDFVSQQRIVSRDPQGIQDKSLHASFDGPAVPKVGSPVVILKRKASEQPEIYSPDRHLMGSIQSGFPARENAWVMGYVENESSVKIRHAGPIST